MSSTDTNKSNVVFVTIKMPNGQTQEIPMLPKTFSTGRQGYYSQVPSFLYEGEMYGGQIQIWKKGEGKNKVK